MTDLEAEDLRKLVHEIIIKFMYDRRTVCLELIREHINKALENIQFEKDLHNR